jgi:hypothetical protein
MKRLVCFFRGHRWRGDLMWGSRCSRCHQASAGLIDQQRRLNETLSRLHD